MSPLPSYTSLLFRCRQKGGHLSLISFTLTPHPSPSHRRSSPLSPFPSLGFTPTLSLLCLSLHVLNFEHPLLVFVPPFLSLISIFPPLPVLAFVDTALRSLISPPLSPTLLSPQAFIGSNYLSSGAYCVSSIPSKSASARPLPSLGTQTALTRAIGKVKQGFRSGFPHPPPPAGFAMARAGTVLGPVILLVVAIITDHCCALIVKCKREAVQQAMQRSGASTSSAAVVLLFLCRRFFLSYYLPIFHTCLSFPRS